MGGNLWGTV